jgi:hypothetical protein
MSIMKNINTNLLESYSSSGTYQIEIKGEIVLNYLFYLQMKCGLQLSVSTNKGQTISTLTGIISNREKFTEVINTISEYGYEITSVKKIGP